MVEYTFQFERSSASNLIVAVVQRSLRQRIRIILRLERQLVFPSGPSDGSQHCAQSILGCICAHGRAVRDDR